MSLSAPEVRGITLLYHEILRLLLQPLPAATRITLEEFCVEIVETCRETTNNSEAARWARSIVGPVLAAAIGSVTYMRENARNPTQALRIFGLTGNHALSDICAWALVEPYIEYAVVPPEAIDKIGAAAELRLKLPSDPSPTDVLVELTRQRRTRFGSQVAHWLVEYFRTHKDEDGPYAGYYRDDLVNLRILNEHGDLANISKVTLIRGPVEREDWEALVRGRLSDARLEIRAATSVTRKFIVEYWHRWQLPEKSANSEVQNGPI